MRYSGKVEFVLLLEPSFIDVGEAIDHAVEIHAPGNKEHLALVASGSAIQDSYDNHDCAGYEPVYLVVGKGMALVDVGDLVCADAVVGDRHKQGGRNEGKRKHAGKFGAG